MCCGVNDAPDVDLQATVGIVEGHAYGLLNVKTLSNGQRIVQLRNPWGATEWQGAWSDASPLWTEELKAEVGGLETGNEGLFWMGFQVNSYVLSSFASSMSYTYSIIFPLGFYPLL